MKSQVSHQNISYLLGQRITKVRMSQKLSSLDLAKRCSIPFAKIIDGEQGSCKISFINLFIVVTKGLDLDLGDFLKNFRIEYQKPVTLEKQQFNDLVNELE